MLQIWLRLDDALPHCTTNLHEHGNLRSSALVLYVAAVRDATSICTTIYLLSTAVHWSIDSMRVGQAGASPICNARGLSMRHNLRSRSMHAAGTAPYFLGHASVLS